ncbi:MAG: helix-turn-helix domain-containing protein, partial [Lachnospiraceae bacterium]|nr:helix-turn-helix domain-containing protein [Lachnospiraceae bacterium]
TRVKKLRKSLGLSQAQLAELLDISVPHMSNIENGKTNFSFPVFVNLVYIFDVSADMLLYGQDASKATVQCMVLQEINEQLMGCSEVQMQIIGNSVRNTKKLLQQYDEKIKKMN